MTEFTTWRSLVDGANISAIPDKTILQPNSDDLTHFSGDTGDFDINDNNPLFEGPLSLKYPQDGSVLTITSSSGLENYPQVGKTHSFFVNPQFDSGSDEAWARIHWAGGDYRIQVLEDNNEVRLLSDDEIDSANVAINDWMAFETLHEANGNITTKVFDASEQDASSYRDGSVLTTLSGSDSSGITDGSYDNNAIEFQSLRNTEEVVELWRTE